MKAAGRGVRWVGCGGCWVGCECEDWGCSCEGCGCDCDGVCVVVAWVSCGRPPSDVGAAICRQSEWIQGDAVDVGAMMVLYARLYSI